MADKITPKQVGRTTSCDYSPLNSTLRAATGIPCAACGIPATEDTVLAQHHSQPHPGTGRVSIARLAEVPFTRTPRRYARHRARSAPTKSRPRGSRAVLADPNCLCDGEPGSRRPPGGRVAAWDPNLQIYHDDIK